MLLLLMFMTEAIIHQFPPFVGGSVFVGKWLMLPNSDHEVWGLNPAEGGIELMTVWRFFTQSLSL